MPGRRRETREQQCHRKLRFTDYLTALIQARSLAEPGIVIYPCPICDGLHLGHQKLRHSAFCQQERKKMVQALRRRIERHQRVVEEHTQWIRTFTDRLEALLICNDPGVDIE